MDNEEILLNLSAETKKYFDDAFSYLDHFNTYKGRFDDEDKLCKNVFKSMKTSNPPRGSNASPSKLVITRYFGFNAPDKMPEEYGFILHILHYNVS